MNLAQPSPGSHRFRIVRQLGAGGMGVVYEAEDRERRQRVALKTLKNASADTLYRLKQEFRALAELEHPNLVTLHELFVADGTSAATPWGGQDPGPCFMTMELVDGVDIREYVKQDEARLRAVLPQLARGLLALHDSGKIHRDVKPPNVLVTGEGRVVLVDFGLVTHAEGAPNAPVESLLGRAVGTVAYMSPEQCCGDVRVTPAADWYAVGVVLYELLTGRVPFEGPMMRVFVEKQQRAPPPPRAIVPSVPKDLDELCTALLERLPGDRPDGRTVLRRLGAAEHELTGATTSMTRAGGFAGRDAELGVLREKLAAMLDLRGSAVLVRGATGLGKSVLVQRFLESARADHRELVVLRGRCYERETVPYQAMDSLIDDLSHYLRSLSAADAASLMPREAGLLPRVFPVLGRVAAIASAPRAREIADPQELRTRAFSALREVLQRIGERHPLVVALDDMHWVDASTLSVLADVLRPPDAPVMLLLLATRDEGSRALEQLFERAGLAHAIVDLAPLSSAASIELAQRLLGSDAAHQAKEVAREANGNPFFLGELVKFVQTSDRAALRALRLEDVIRARVAQLSPSGRRVLELVAASDEPVSRRVLATAADVSPEALAREIAMLRSLHFVRLAGGLADDRIEPYHGRVREVVLLTTSAEERRGHHRSLALALGQWNEGTPEGLALLWHSAGDRARARENALKAADDAVFRLHFDRAAELFKLVIEMSEGDDARALRGIHRRLGDALASAGRPREAAVALLRACEGADGAERLELRRLAAENLLRGGYLEAGLVEVRGVLEAIKMRLAPTPLRALVSLLLVRAWLTIRGLGFRERPVSRIAPEELTKVDVAWSVASGLAVVDNIRGAHGQARHVLLALRAGEPTRIARALAIEAAFLASTGATKRARAANAGCRALASRIGSEYALALGSFAEGFVDYFCESRWRAGFETYAEAEERFRRHLAAGWEIDTSSMFSCLCQLYGGDVGALGRRVPALVQEAERRGDLYQSVSLRTRLNGVWLFRDDVAGAERDLREAVDAWSRASFQVQHFFAMGSRCNLALYQGRPEDAAANLARDLAPLARSMLTRVTMVRIETHETRARVALAFGARATSVGGDRQRFAAEARTFARKLARDPVPVGRSLAIVLEAGASRVAGDVERAVQELRRALGALEKQETMLHATAARRRLGEAVGGDEGRAMIARADEWFAREGVKNPARTVAMLVPGWPDAG